MQVVKGQILEVSWQVPVLDVIMGCGDGGEVLLDRALQRARSEVFGDICRSAVLEGVNGCRALATELVDGRLDLAGVGVLLLSVGPAAAEADDGGSRTDCGEVGV
jgi:hypothetical protein